VSWQDVLEALRNADYNDLAVNIEKTLATDSETNQGEYIVVMCMRQVVRPPAHKSQILLSFDCFAIYRWDFMKSQVCMCVL